MKKLDVLAAILVVVGALNWGLVAVARSLASVAREAAQDGRPYLRVLPLFLAAGGHMAEDIPRQIAAVQMTLPQFTIELLQPIGEHPRVLELFREIASEYARI